MSIIKFAQTFWMAAKKGFHSYRKHDTASLGAALSYYTIFSLAPVLIIVIAVAGMFFGPEAVHGELHQQLRGLIGEDGAGQVETMIKAAYQPGQGMFATMAAGVMLLVGATSVFGQLRTSLNSIWEISPRPAAGC